MKTIDHLALDTIAPSGTNPRKHLDAKSLGELIDSVRKHGVLQPILVRPGNGKPPKYRLVAGERRVARGQGGGPGRDPGRRARAR